MKVFKYEVEVRVDLVEVRMPAGARIIRFAPQGPLLNLYVWAIVDDEAPDEVRALAIVGTGHRIPEGSVYVASCEAGPYIWHLFEQAA